MIIVRFSCTWSEQMYTANVKYLYPKNTCVLWTPFWRLLVGTLLYLCQSLTFVLIKFTSIKSFWGWHQMAGVLQTTFSKVFIIIAWKLLCFNSDFIKFCVHDPICHKLRLVQALTERQTADKKLIEPLVNQIYDTIWNYFVAMSKNYVFVSKGRHSSTTIHSV